MSERKAVTKKLALEYRRSDKAHKGELMNQVCALNGWHRSHARKALKQALTLKVVKSRPPRKPLYGAAVIKALQFLWAVQGTPCRELVRALAGRCAARPGAPRSELRVSHLERASGTSWTS